MKTSVSIPPIGWAPRAHQQQLWDYLENGGKRALAIWHRRAGKDEVCLNFTAVAAMERVGNYWHCLPEYAQCRKAIWTAVNPHTGKRRIDEAFPHELRSNTNDNEMFIRFVNGSTWQCIGSDSYSTAVGASTVGIIFSEYALANPAAWAYFRPMVEENDGWAAFITTPRGRNHAFAMFQYAAQQPGWFCELLSAKDTGALSDAALAEALGEMTALYGEDMGKAMFEQELMCSFNAAILGAFYALEMQAVRAEGRITEIEPVAGQPVHRAWDLGIGDDTSIWWFQVVGAQIFILDHYSASGVGLDHFVEVIEKRHKERGWTHGNDHVPHDAKVKELGTGRTRVETMQALGLHPVLVPLASIDDGINAARRALPLCVFHPRTEETGVAALEQYRREWDDDKKAFKANAIHDWTSHPADAFRYLAMSWKPAPPRQIKLPPKSGFYIPPPEDMPRRQRRWGT